MPSKNLLNYVELVFNDQCIAIVNSSSNGKNNSLSPASLLNVELDVERRLQADVLKDRIRIKQFFQDFDRLRKGTVGVAAVRFTLMWTFVLINDFSSEHA